MHIERFFHVSGKVLKTLAFTSNRLGHQHNHTWDGVSRLTEPDSTGHRHGIFPIYEYESLYPDNTSTTFSYDEVQALHNHLVMPPIKDKVRLELIRTQLEGNPNITLGSE